MKHTYASLNRNYSTESSYSAYLAAINRFDILTPEEERYWVKRAAKGDDYAVNKLVNANLRLVVKIASTYQIAQSHRLDLIQEGNLGLMHGVRKFDPKKNVRLSTYAQFWIRAYMLKYLMDNHKLIKLGTTQVQRKLFYNLRKEQRRLTKQGIEPTPELLAKTLNVKVKDIEEMQERLYAAELSIYTTTYGAEDCFLIDSLEAEAQSPAQKLDHSKASKHIKKRLDQFRNKLKGRDIEIWDLRMTNENPMTLQELGEHFSISRERARQLEARIAKNLKKFLHIDQEYVEAYEIDAGC